MVYARTKKQERFYEHKLNMDVCKEELLEEMNGRSKYINEDSAKKIACMQGMDYEGFRQMVLGCNLFCSKAGRVENIVRAGGTQGNELNPYMAYDRIISRDQEDIGFDEEVVKATLALTESEHLQMPRNMEEFEKFLVKKCKEPIAKYTYMRLISFDHYSRVFFTEFDGELLLHITRLLDEQVLKNEAFNTEAELMFIACFMATISRSPGFDFVLTFLDEKELEVVRDVVKASIAGIEN